MSEVIFLLTENNIALISSLRGHSILATFQNWKQRLSNKTYGLYDCLVVLLPIIIFLVYFPSLFHLPREDQFYYLLQTKGVDGFFALVTKFYSYARTRTYYPGDRLTFRPVFMAYLGAQKWAFGTHFIYSQMMGILLHILICFQVLKLLKAINVQTTAEKKSEPIFALAFVFMFATMPLVMEMVIWAHINGYLVALLFMLIAFNHSLQYIESAGTNRSSFVITILALFIAAFTYEIMAVYSVLVLLALFISKWQGRLNKIGFLKAAALLSPLIIYCAASFVDDRFKDYSLRHNDAAVSALNHIAWNPGFLWTICKAGYKITDLWFRLGLIPTIARVLPTPRLSINRISYVDNWLYLTPFMKMNLAAAFCLFFYTLLGASKTLAKRWLPMLFLFVTAYLMYLGFLIFGSFLDSGINYLLGSALYDSYTAWIFVGLIIFTCVDFDLCAKFLPSWFRKAALASFATLLCLNCAFTYSVNASVTKNQSGKRNLVDIINKFIERHKNENAFSFKIDAHSPDDETLEVLEVTKSGEKKYSLHFTDFLFGRYINAADPKYVLTWNEDSNDFIQRANDLPKKP